MLKAMILTAMLAIGAGALAWGEEAPATQPAADGTPINTYCAVEHDDKVDSRVTVVYDGKVIGFCCKDCVKKFEKDPEKYMKDLK